ncbi:MAG: YeeE/YedE thiosulfate transporter family protein, partial [Bacteroidetes bacterium]|nr:YeeE/YedE thiosulfate transporter family protein [Bacteroidota bacterium]
GVIMSAIVVGMISILLIKKFNAKSIEGEVIKIEPKKFSWGNVIGGIIFGLGWALTGACPGPLYALVGAGVYVMAIALLAAVLGVWVYGKFQHKLPH